MPRGRPPAGGGPAVRWVDADSSCDGHVPCSRASRRRSTPPRAGRSCASSRAVRRAAEDPAKERVERRRVDHRHKPIPRRRGQRRAARLRRRAAGQLRGGLRPLALRHAARAFTIAGAGRRRRGCAAAAAERRHSPRAQPRTARNSTSECSGSIDVGAATRFTVIANSALIITPTDATACASATAPAAATSSTATPSRATAGTASRSAVRRRRADLEQRRRVQRHRHDVSAGRSGIRRAREQDHDGRDGPAPQPDLRQPPRRDRRAGYRSGRHWAT